MIKINRNALRFALTVTGVAVGTAMLGHLAPPKVPVAEAESELLVVAGPADPAPLPRSVTAPPRQAPAPAQVAPAPVSSAPAPVSSAPAALVVKTTPSGGRVVILGRTATTTASAQPAPAFTETSVQTAVAYTPPQTTTDTPSTPVPSQPVATTKRPTVRTKGS